MLVYYDDYVIVTKNSVTYGNKEFYVAGPVIKIYIVDNFVLICCSKIAYVFCKITKSHKYFMLPDSFVVNKRGDELYVVDLKESMFLSVMMSTVIKTSLGGLSIVFYIYVRSSSLKDDLPTVPLRTSVLRSFRGFEDIMVAFE